jgi:hypothetical protein
MRRPNGCRRGEVGRSRSVVHPSHTAFLVDNRKRELCLCPPFPFSFLLTSSVYHSEKFSALLVARPSLVSFFISFLPSPCREGRGVHRNSVDVCPIFLTILASNAWQASFPLTPPHISPGSFVPGVPWEPWVPWAPLALWERGVPWRGSPEGRDPALLLQWTERARRGKVGVHGPCWLHECTMRSHHPAEAVGEEAGEGELLEARGDAVVELSGLETCVAMPQATL